MMLYQRYYQNSEISLERFTYIWRESASMLDIDPELLRPTDRFDSELTVPGPKLVDETEELWLFLQYECRRLGISAKAMKIETMDELIRFLGQPAAN
jgi:hypothetical protein